MSIILQTMELAVIPNLYLSIQDKTGTLWTLAAVTNTGRNILNDNTIIGFAEDTNRIVFFPRESIEYAELYSTLDEENK